MTYDLRSLSLPRLGTTALRALVALLENPITGGTLVEKLRRDAGFERLLGTECDETPTFVPLLPNITPAAPALIAAPEWPTRRGYAPWSSDDYTAAYRDGTLTPSDVAERFLAQQLASDAAQPPLRAFIAIKADDLRAQAKASTERWRAGAPRGELDGVPVAVKDEMDVAGYPTTVGTRFLGKPPAVTDAVAVARLRAAGALIVGKANMHEIGIDVTGLNPHHGTPRNPYNEDHHTGGSSSGSACAVGAGLVPIALGADGGGSVRIPAAFCGVFGLKLTFGRVAETGAAPLAWTVSNIGPIAATARDLARAYALIAGPDASDPNSLQQPPVEIDASAPAALDGLVIGIYWPWFRHATPAMVRTTEALLDQLVAAGATLREIALPGLEPARLAHATTILSEMNAAMGPHMRAHRRDFSLAARANLRIGAATTAGEYVHAQRIRTRISAAFESAFQSVDVIVTPATGRVAPPIRPDGQPDGESDLSMTTEVMRFAFPPNFTGHPAVSIPAGYDDAGLPISLQLIGKGWSEQLLLRCAVWCDGQVERRAPRRYYPGWLTPTEG